MFFRWNMNLTLNSKKNTSVNALLQSLNEIIDELISSREFDQKICPVDKDYLRDVKPRMRKYITNGD